MKNLVLATMVAQEFTPSFSWWYIPVVALLLLIAVMIVAYRAYHRVIRFPGVAAVAAGLIVFVLLRSEVRDGLAQILINHYIRVHGEWSGDFTGATGILVGISAIYGVAVFILANLAKWAAYGKCAYREEAQATIEEVVEVAKEQRAAERRRDMVIDHIITTTTPIRKGEVKVMSIISSRR